MRTATLFLPGGEQRTLSVPTPEAWKEVADVILPLLRPGIVLTLSGDLGAGKTTFVQALAERLGVPTRPQSPTFALLRIHTFPSFNGVERLLHVDAYRIQDGRELLALDVQEELADGKSFLVLEWPENVAAWLTIPDAQHLHLSLS